MRLEWLDKEEKALYARSCPVCFWEAVRRLGAGLMSGGLAATVAQLQAEVDSFADAHGGARPDWHLAAEGSAS